jgi:hypothetical protein
MRFKEFFYKEFILENNGSYDDEYESVDSNSELGHFDEKLRDILSNKWDGYTGKLLKQSDGGYFNGGSDWRVVDLKIESETYDPNIDDFKIDSEVYRVWFNASDEGGTNIDKAIKLS